MVSETDETNLIDPNDVEQGPQNGEEEPEQEIEEQGQEDEDEDDMDASAMSGTDSLLELSPEEQANRDAKHREKDERRLQLDLSGHQQIISDSHKMNQSLKRCLNWSEMMIRDGTRALAYSVRVSDVELGGRILPPPDEEGDEDVSIPGIDDLDDTSANDYGSCEDLSTADLNIEPELWVKRHKDRDSGIDMPA